MNSTSHSAAPVKLHVATAVIPLRRADIDSAAHVNNTNYFRFMEEARMVWYESHGIEGDFGDPHAPGRKPSVLPPGCACGRRGDDDPPPLGVASPPAPVPAPNSGDQSTLISSPAGGGAAGGGVDEQGLAECACVEYQGPSENQAAPEAGVAVL